MLNPSTLDRLSPAAQSFIGKEKTLFIGGRWTAVRHGEAIEVFDPATGCVFDKVPSADELDVDDAVKAARAAFDGGPWSKLTPMDRGKLIWRLGDLVESHADELAEIEALDNGKPITYARWG